MKTRKIIYVVLIVIVVATLLFIWRNSIQSVNESQKKSLSVGEVIKPVLEVFVGAGNVTDYLIRKLAHFTEFFMLGGELVALLIIRQRVRYQAIIKCLLFVLIAAVIDETIQLFSHRGSQVQDVILDFIGGTTGIMFVSLIYRMVGQIKNRDK